MDVGSRVEEKGGGVHYFIYLIFDYAGFLLISLNNNDKHKLQIMQNDALRFCKGLQLLDKEAIKILHDSISLLSLEQRRQEQLLNIMFNHARNGIARNVTNVNTRRQKLDTKMCRKYERSPYFLGTKLWDNIDKESQDLPCRFAFKKKWTKNIIR